VIPDSNDEPVDIAMVLEGSERPQIERGLKGGTLSAFDDASTFKASQNVSLAMKVR
jgi:hypothetical protein